MKGFGVFFNLSGLNPAPMSSAKKEEITDMFKGMKKESILTHTKIQQIAKRAERDRQNLINNLPYARVLIFGIIREDGFVETRQIWLN